MSTLRTVAALAFTLCAILLVPGCKEEAAKAAPTPPTVTVAVPIEREVRDYDEYTGRLKEVNRLEVRARVRGYLKSIGFKDGDLVAKDQLLFQIDPAPFEAQVKIAKGQLNQVKARKTKAEADVNRYKDLVPKGAATQQDLDKAIGELGEAEAGIFAAEAQVEEAELNLGYARLTSSIDGVASKANLTVGNLVGASGLGAEQLLTTVLTVDPIHVYFDVDQRRLQEIRRDALKRRGDAPAPKSARDLSIIFQFGLASEEGFPHEGVLDFIDNEADKATGTVMVRGEAKNPQRLFKPGEFARVRLAVADPYRTLLVMERAIGTQQGQKYVLVTDDKNTVVLRPVTLGALQPDNMRVIKSGLSAGERVIINGIQRARPGLPVTPEQGSMAPTTRPAATQPARSGN